MHSILHRPAFVEAHPELKEAHRAAQRAFFAAANRAGLQTDEAHKDAALDGINDALNRKGSRRLISRKQLKIEEMEALTVAIEAGLFTDNWVWGHDFMLYIRTATVRVASVHFEPLSSERAAALSQPAPPRPVGFRTW